MSARTRLVLGLGSLAGLGALLVWAVAGLPDFGHPRGPYADLAPRIMLDERHVANAVTGITFDLRGFDTLGEELILFVAALGAAVLLRALRTEGAIEAAAAYEERRGPGTTDALRALGAVLVGPLLLLGIYVVVHGALDAGRRLPGRRPARGGAAARVRRRAGRGGRAGAAGRRSSRSPTPSARPRTRSSRSRGLVFGVAVMDNVLPYGTTGSLLSGGTVPVLSVAVGVEVTAGVTLILSEFVDQMLLRSRGGD